jgi:hypothetical protein
MTGIKAWAVFERFENGPGLVVSVSLPSLSALHLPNDVEKNQRFIASEDFVNCNRLHKSGNLKSTENRIYCTPEDIMGAEKDGWNAKITFEGGNSIFRVQRARTGEA